MNTHKRSTTENSHVMGGRGWSKGAAITGFRKEVGMSTQGV